MADPTSDPKSTDPKADEKTFTQAELNKIVEERLKREREKFSDYDAVKAVAAKAQELEDAKKSGEQKLADEIRALKDDLAQERQQALIAKVAAEKGVPTRLWGRLEGTTRQELEADADDLLESFPAAKNDDAKDAESNAGAGFRTIVPDDANSRNDRGDPGRRPKEKLRSGAVSEGEPDETDPAKLAAMVPRGF